MKGSSRTVSFSFITNVMYRCWDCGNDCVLLNVYLKAASHLLRVGGLKKLFCSDILSQYIGNQNTLTVIKIISFNIKISKLIDKQDKRSL